MKGATSYGMLSQLADKFQSTLPVKGATSAEGKQVAEGVISIHAPREGSDAVAFAIQELLGDFNPRSP